MPTLKCLIELSLVFLCTLCLTQVNHGAVEPTNTALLARIASLNPTSMSWSNVCDYIHPAEFHAMARACSCTGVHTAHMMNYVKCVKGTCHMDYLLSTPMFASWVSICLWCSMILGRKNVLLELVCFPSGHGLITALYDLAATNNCTLASSCSAMAGGATHPHTTTALLTLCHEYLSRNLCIRICSY